jgi:hypothetical protein
MNSLTKVISIMTFHLKCLHQWVNAVRIRAGWIVENCDDVDSNDSDSDPS